MARRLDVYPIFQKMKSSKINVEKNNKILEAIASKFPRRSNEYKALELAAKALLFVKNRKTKQEFEVFLQSFHSDLTSQQKRRLREMGIPRKKRQLSIFRTGLSQNGPPQIERVMDGPFPP